MKKAKILSARNFVSETLAGNVSVEAHTHKILEEIAKANKKFHHFCAVDEKGALQRAKGLDKERKAGKAKGRLFGLPVSVKDCLCVKGLETRASSRILSGYVPTFDATCVARAKAEGAIIIGKTVQDEFGFGTFSVNVGEGFDVPKNPFDPERSCGGSSGGSGGFTALTEFSHVSIGESTGGSIEAPASFNGVVGFCPTYGRVSRYGLLDYANSLDKIGPMAKTVDDAALMLDCIAGHDENDSTSLDAPAENYSEAAGRGKAAKGLKVGLVKEFFGNGIDEKVKSVVMEGVERLKENGAKVSEVSLPLNAEFGVSTYYLIAVSEASTNLAKYCGIRYGAQESLEGGFDEYFSKVRSRHFGEEAKRRIILGTFARMSGYRDAYYLKAMKVRTKLIAEFKKSFGKFDALLCPTMPVVAPKFSEIEKLSPMQNYAMDLCTVPANLAGIPHVSVNAGFSKGLPVGLMLMADHLQEKKLFSLAFAAEAGQ